MNQWAHVRQPVEADSSFRVNQGNFDLKNNIWILASNNKITAPYSLVIEYTWHTLLSISILDVLN